MLIAGALPAAQTALAQTEYPSARADTVYPDFVSDLPLDAIDCYAINGDTLDIKLSFVRTTLCETFNFRFAENGFFAKVDILPDHETHTLAGVVL